MKILLWIIAFSVVLYVIQSVFSAIGGFMSTLPGFMLVWFSAIIIVGYIIMRKLSKSYIEKNQTKFSVLANHIQDPINLKNYFESVDESEKCFEKAYGMRFFLPKLRQEQVKLYKELLLLRAKHEESFNMKAIDSSFGFYRTLLKDTGSPFSHLFEEEISRFSARFVGNNLEYANVSLKLLRAYEKIAGTIAEVDGMEGHEFEYWCADLLKKNGFTDVEVTKGSGDQGVDIVAVKEGIRYAVQCKCYSSDLGNTPVQEVHAGKAMYKCQVGVVMTNRHFTSGAKELAEVTGVLLWDRDKLEEMLGA